MRELHAGGLLEFLDPLEVVDYESYGFEEGFFKLLEAQPPPPPRYTCRTYSNVFIDKLAYSLFAQLRDWGLTEPDILGRPNWIRLETSTAGCYMAYLAGVMSGARPGTLPVTDHPDPLVALAQPTEGEPQLAQLRFAYIRHALPAPLLTGIQDEHDGVVDGEDVWA
jgi:hypothetical protein